VCVVTGDQSAGQGLELRVHFGGDDHERRQKLLQDVAVTAVQQPGELQQVMADHVQLDTIAYPDVLQRLRPGA